MNKQNCVVIREAIEDNLKEFANEHNLALRFVSGSFNDHNMTCKIEFAVKDESGKTQSKEADDFKFYGPSYGFKVTDLGRSFRLRNQNYTITGLKPRSRLYPILARRDDGKLYKFPPHDVKQALAD